MKVVVEDGGTRFAERARVVFLEWDIWDGADVLVARF